MANLLNFEVIPLLSYLKIEFMYNIATIIRYKLYSYWKSQDILCAIKNGKVCIWFIKIMPEKM